MTGPLRVKWDGILCDQSEIKQLEIWTDLTQVALLLSLET